MATEPERTYPSELPVLALRQTVVFPLTIQPLAINRPMSIEAVNRALAGDRLIFLALQTNDKDEPERDDLHTIGTVAAIRQMAKVPNGGIHVIVEGLMRAKAEHRSRRTDVCAARDRLARVPEAGRQVAGDRGLRAPAARADRPGAVARDRPVAGSARPRRRHRRSAAARLSAVEPARHEAGREAADPRAERAHREARSRGRPRSAARSPCSR